MKHNRICAYCGRSYYVCSSCISAGSYKNSYCSQECFRRSVMNNGSFQPIIVEGEEMKTLLRGKLAGTDIFVDIIGYDLELGKFDCHDGVTRTPDDFRYFVIPCDEMKTINKYVSELNEKKAKTSSRSPVTKKTETERPKHEIKP